MGEQKKHLKGKQLETFLNAMRFIFMRKRNEEASSAKAKQEKFSVNVTNRNVVKISRWIGLLFHSFSKCKEGGRVEVEDWAWSTLLEKALYKNRNMHVTFMHKLWKFYYENSNDCEKEENWGKKLYALWSNEMYLCQGFKRQCDREKNSSLVLFEKSHAKRGRHAKLQCV